MGLENSELFVVDAAPRYILFCPKMKHCSQKCLYLGPRLGVSNMS